jgi:hypothetical protein
MLDRLLHPDVHTDFTEICTFQEWRLNPHIEIWLRYPIWTRRNGWRYTASARSSSSRAHLGSLAHSLAAVRYRFGFGISVIAAFACVAGSKLYSFMRPHFSTPTTTLLEPDIP